MHLKRVTGMFFLVDISFWNSKIIKKLFNHHGFSKVSAFMLSTKIVLDDCI